MRRVLHVIRMAGVSGAENHVRELVKQLPAFGWRGDVLIATPQPDQVVEFAATLREFGSRGVVRRMDRDASLSLCRAIRADVLRRQYAVVHTHLVHADWHVTAAVAGMRRPPALVSTKHNHDRFRMTAPFRQVERALARRFDETITISRSLHDFVLRWSAIRSTVIHYGLSTQGAPARSQAREGQSLLAVARLEPQKGLDVLVDAMRDVVKRHPRVILSIAGEGSERFNLERLVRRYGLEAQVRLLGRREDIGDLMRSADVLVHPARWEGFGLVLLEAMTVGLPTVATRAGAIPEVIGEDGQTGLLVPVDDSRSLAEAVCRLLDDSTLAGALGAAAFERARRYFDPTRMASATAAVYERALISRSRV